jgi:hypothetical protein
LLKYCNNKRDCGTSFGYVCGQNQTCYCDQFYILSSYGDKCVGGLLLLLSKYLGTCDSSIKYPGVGQKCRYDEHCIEGAFCEYQIRCQCKEDLYPTEAGLACSSKFIMKGIKLRNFIPKIKKIDINISIFCRIQTNY